MGETARRALSFDGERGRGYQIKRVSNAFDLKPSFQNCTPAKLGWGHKAHLIFIRHLVVPWGAQVKLFILVTVEEVAARLCNFHMGSSTTFRYTSSRHLQHCDCQLARQCHHRILHAVSPGLA